MKKGETQMVFMFILAALIMGLIVIMGYRGITSLLGTSEEVMIQDFVNSFEKDMRSVERLRGTRRTETYSVPNSIMKVCFVKSCDIREGNCPNNLNPSSLNSFLGDSLFLLGTNDVVLRSESFGKIEIDGGHFCMNNTGRITIKLEGLGDGVKLSN